MSHQSVGITANLEQIEAYFQRWIENPQSVDVTWQNFFEGFVLGLGRSKSLASTGTSKSEYGVKAGVVRLIISYREMGHFLARLDPLNPPQTTHPLLELSEFGLSEADLDEVVDTYPFTGMGPATLRTLIDALQDTYCQTIGVDFRHIQDIPIRKWFQERMEPRRNKPNFDRTRQLRILESLHYAETFERFLQTKYSGQKRFSLEGSETLIPVLETIVERAPDLDVREIILGMAHRGRLNVLVNILRKPYQEVFAQFEDKFLPESMAGDGDVKYHLGFSSDRVNSRGGRVHLSLAPNPSHLEAVNPVVEGRTRAKQTLFGDKERRHGVPVLIHGDAAFAGQGLVPETLNLSQLEGYTTGGTIHIVVNNQIGFTTNPRDARSSKYCTDVAKMISAPIFHVNCEDPEAACFVTELALEFRQEFRQDVVIDLIGYRKHGHNEADDPSQTQPLMYRNIQERPTLTEVYSQHLMNSGMLTVTENEEIKARFKAKLEDSSQKVKSGPAHYPIMHGFEGSWKGLTSQYSHDPVETGVNQANLAQIVDTIQAVPSDFKPHPKVFGMLGGWKQTFDQRQGITWGLGEALAFGSLLLEGHPIRLSGQDSRRGTFSHRHAVIHDVQTGATFTPLTQLSPTQATFEVYDSHLSEAAALGFEYGYSLDMPNALVLWEAQFGDFANGAQVIADQFISSSESKWSRDSGVVLLLPHGYEGQGPEHSSARLERWLQLCAEDNMQVVNASTPAQYFHLLRRQIHRKFRKPLVIMTPKSLLRGGGCVSNLDEFLQGWFHEVLDDTTVDPNSTKRVVFCSGKVYYDLLKERTALNLTNVALVRVEQFHPFPEELIQRVLLRYKKASEWVWAQEESQNNGAWFFMEPRLRALGCGNLQYVGRDASSSPATGSYAVHNREQAELVAAALTKTAPYIVRATNLTTSTTTPATAAPTTTNGTTDHKPTQVPKA
jgi:2-oxoglutarate dehydrogenase E1 component